MSSERVPLDGNLTNTVVGSPNLYTGDIEWSSFDYKLSTAVCVFFTALFAISFGESPQLASILLSLDAHLSL